MTPEHVALLREADFDERAGTLRLTTQLDPKTYAAFKGALTKLGCKWNSSRQLFIVSPAHIAHVRSARETGVLVDRKKVLQAFFTPCFVADDVAERAALRGGLRVLEPSCGDGQLIWAMLRLRGTPPTHITGYELDEHHLRACREALATVPHDGTTIELHQGDFLSVPPPVKSGWFDRVVMNPPFTKNQDVLHVLHALKFLDPKGGRIAAIMAANTSRRVFVELLKHFDGRYTVHEFEAGDFGSSGTQVKTICLTGNIGDPKL